MAIGDQTLPEFAVTSRRLIYLISTPASKKDHGDEMRCGLETLRVSEPCFRELGLPGFAAPFSVN
jgi:hypothetical protein